MRTTRKPRGRRGSIVIETAIFLPLLFILLVAMEQIAKVTYTYYSIKKIEYTVARYVATQQGVNFCAGQSDPAIAAGINLALTGTTDATGTPFVPNLTADMFVIQPERVDPTTGIASICSCDVTGCDESAGGGSPNYISVSIPSGYPVQPIIPFTTLQTIPLVPIVKVPYEGT
jgi:hypothetical protein